MASITLNVDNATPSPTMRDVLPFVKAAFGIANADTQHDEELAMLAELALEKYSELAPLIKRTNISPIAQQLSYPLPGDCRQVFDVYAPPMIGYYNDWVYLPMIDTPASTLFGVSAYAFRNPSERVVRQGILNELDHYVQSFTGWYVDGTPPQLYVLPVTPATNPGQPFVVRYGADYTWTSGALTTDPVISTLPAGHYRHLIRLMKWAAADQRADAMTSQLAVSAAGQGTSAATESWKLANRADRILQDVRSALGADVPVTMRGDQVG